MRTETTDYELPSWWNDDDVTDEERSQWLTRERCRRMAERQYTPYLDAREAKQERLDRKVEAKSGAVSLEDMR